jgi:hypothetical protein
VSGIGGQVIRWDPRQTSHIHPICMPHLDRLGARMSLSRCALLTEVADSSTEPCLLAGLGQPQFYLMEEMSSRGQGSEK